MQTVIKSLSTKPTAVKFVTGAEVPEGLTNLATTTAVGADTAGIQQDDSSMIGVFQDGTTLYIAPMNSPATSDSTGVAATAANNSYVMHTPVDASSFFNLVNMGFDETTNKYDTITELDLGNLDTSKTENMSRMFYLCQGVTSIDVSKFDTSKVTNMSDMFYYMSSLTTLDVSKFDTSNVTDMRWMFQRCLNLESITGLNTFNTEKVTQTNVMFSQCEKLKSLDLSSFNMSLVTSMSNMFYACNMLQEITLGENFEFKGTDGYLPEPSTTYITGADGKWYDTTTGTGYTPADQASYHNNLNATRTYSVFPTSYTIDKTAMQTALKTLSSSNPTALKFVTGNSSEISGLTCISAASDGIQADRSAKIGVFTSGTTIYIAPMDNSGNPVNNSNVMYAPEDSSSLMNGYSGGMSISTLTSMDLSNLDTSNVTDMSYMFCGNQKLTSLTFGSFDTSKVTSMYSMFNSLEAMTTLDVSKLDTRNVTDMGMMFYDCQKLTSLSFGENFSTAKVTNFGSMFGCCYVLPSVDVSGFDTSKATSINGMFYQMQKVTSLDLSSFDTSSVTSMSNMFWGCSKLVTIYVNGGKFVTSNVTSSGSMFLNCTSLVGGSSTLYNKLYTDKTYAHIDGGTSNPGYFTAKSQWRVRHLRATSPRSSP